MVTCWLSLIKTLMFDYNSVSKNKKGSDSPTQTKHINLKSFPAAHQRPGLWSEHTPDITWKKKDDKWFCHQIQTKQMKGRLSKSPQVTTEHEMIFSCRFDGLDNAWWQWMRRPPNRTYSGVKRLFCLAKIKSFSPFLFYLILRKGFFLCLTCCVYSEHEWVPLVGLQ